MRNEFGKPLRHLRECPSTNTLARELAENGAPHGTVVTTGRQTAGRGRQGRSWATTPDGTMLAYSAIYRSTGEGPDPIPALLPLAVAIAACEAIEDLAPVKAAAKWPNDIWLEGKKVAGILVEARPRDGWAVIGVGINLSVEPEHFPDEVRGRATSVGHGVAPETARDQLNLELACWTAASEEAVLAAFADRDALSGRAVTWEESGTMRSGTAAGVNADGNLVVDTEDKPVVLNAGEVHLAS